uniref:Uncharacterized protein n=1 Tax=Anopheles culicifacies TaxID=139723 RepID=A0A182MAS2_9DIPT
PEANGYGYYQQPSSYTPTAAGSQNVAVYGGNPNYYGVPGYEDHRSVSSRKDWNDNYLRWKWNKYYNSYYYPYPSGSGGGGGGGWSNRNGGIMFYNSKRRQDSVQPTDIKPETTTTQRPRKKKLFVPNVWG